MVSICCLVLFFFMSVWNYAFSPGPDHHNKTEEVFIYEGAGLKEIRKLLAEKNVISDDIRFEFLAVMMNLSHRLKAGEYDFPDRAIPFHVLHDLQKGSVKYREVTVPEGATVNQVADLMDLSGVVPRNSLLSYVSDPEAIAQFGLNLESLEGYLFPDTYRFLKGTSPEIIVRKMLERFQTIYDLLLQEYNQEATLSMHEIVTLASIVEKETGYAPERPLIARVFLNRLEKGMPLQADPTVIYGLEKFDGNLRRSDLKTFSPYNTYMIKGLPRGPIANPGKASMEAVLKPADGQVLYFVSKNDGTHHFSETLQEHNKAVRKYQK